MARVAILRTASPLVRVLYLVDGAVGRKQINRRDDVALVQYMLKMIWGRTIDGKFFGKGHAPIVDGVFGDRTYQAILDFQTYLWGLNAPYYDGMIEPLPHDRFFSPNHNLIYTIISLNLNFAAVYGIDRHFRMPAEAGFPNSLKIQMFVEN